MLNRDTKLRHHRPAGDSICKCRWFNSYSFNSHPPLHPPPLSPSSHPSSSQLPSPITVSTGRQRREEEVLFHQRREKLHSWCLWLRCCAFFQFLSSSSSRHWSLFSTDGDGTIEVSSSNNRSDFRWIMGIITALSPTHMWVQPLGVSM